MCSVMAHLSAQIRYSLDDCKQMAIENNKKIKNSLLEINAAKEVKKDAFTNYFPSVSAPGLGFKAKDSLVTLDMGGAPLSFLNDGMTAAISVSQPVFVGGKIVYGNKLADLGIQVSQYQSKLSENEILLNTENLYWQLVSLHEKEKTLDIIDSQRCFSERCRTVIRNRTCYE